MKHYHNKQINKRIGEQVRKLREGHGWEIEDIAEMSGFSYNQIRAVEKGEETDISHIVQIAFAIGVQPQEVFNIPFKIKARYSLSPQRKEKSRLTKRINELIEETNFFSTPKFVEDVALKLKEKNIKKITSSSISVILLRKVKEGKLSVTTVGRRNRYRKK